MCVNPDSASIDLGRQDPRGCRFIYGDPGSGHWRYCQRSIAPGGRMGLALRPPYCVRHTKVAIDRGMEWKWRAYAKFLERIAQSEETLPADAAAAFWSMIPVDAYIASRAGRAEGVSHG